MLLNVTPSWLRWSGLSCDRSAPARVVVVVKGRPGSASRACWPPPRAPRGARGRDRCAPGAARSSARRPGASPASCSIRSASAGWNELAVGAAALSRRALDPREARAGARRRRRARRGPRPHVAGVQRWPSAGRRCWSSTTCIGPTRRRCAGWCSSRPDCAELRLGVLCAVRAGEPPARRTCSPNCSPRPPSRRSAAAARARRGRGARRRTAARRRSGVRARLPCGQRRQPVPASRAARPPRRRADRADRDRSPHG